MTALKRTPLYPMYQKYGAKTIEFSGWELPVQFTGIQQEHHAVRTSAGLFDVSHMGEIIVHGAGAASFLQSLVTNDLRKQAVGQARYAFMCYPDGGVVDDLLVYKLGEDRFMLVVNAANKDKVMDWLRQHLISDVLVEDISDQTALIALQGPKAKHILLQTADPVITELKPFRFLQDVQVAGVSAIVSRTGYTGEDGFEIFLPASSAIDVWEKCFAAGQDVQLCAAGLGARDTLRFEASLPLYGQELSPEITPIEAGLGMFVKLDKGDFIGREALAQQVAEGPRRKLAGIEMIDRGIPRTGYSVYADQRKIGHVTSGTHAPTLKKNIGLALLEVLYTEPGQIVEVEIRGKRLKARVVNLPFYKRSTTK